MSDVAEGGERNPFLKDVRKTGRGQDSHIGDFFWYNLLVLYQTSYCLLISPYNKIFASIPWRLWEI